MSSQNARSLSAKLISTATPAQYTVSTAMSFPKTPAIVSDCVLFDANERVLLVRRGSEPFKGWYSLPGGFVEIGETVESACAREVGEETGVSISEQEILLVGVYSEPDRDPRGHIVSIAYTTRLDTTAEPKAGSDADSAEWIADWSKLSLAFNHADIIADAQSLLQTHPVPR
jgi:8-oxo-dGTP diphosphatase